MPQTAEDLRHLSILRGSNRTRVKAAELGGDGQDTTFEQSFVSLARTYLRDKAPGLLDYEVGFQLLERNQDNTRAVGIFGFKVGPQWLYAPVFFLNGDLKGHELLYLKNTDQFVPMKENWLNFLLNRKPPLLGEEVNRQSSRLGVMAPDLQPLRRVPYKFASHTPEWLQGALPAIGRLVTSNPLEGERFALPKFLKESSEGIQSFLQLGLQQPELVNMAARVYGQETLDEAVKAAAARPKVLLAGPRLRKRRGLKPVTSILPPTAEEDLREKEASRLQFILPGTELPLWDSLTEKEAEEIVQKGMVIRDERQFGSMVVETQAPLKAENPTQTGLYDLLTSPNHLERVLILQAPYSTGGQHSWATVIRLDGDKNFLNIHNSHLWTECKLDDQWQSFYDGLPSADSDLELNATYVFIGKKGQGSVPIKIEQKLSAGDGAKRYKVWCRDYADRGRADHFSKQPMGTTPFHGDSVYADQRVVHINRNADTKMRLVNGVLYVPSGAKALKVLDANQPASSDCCMSSDSKDGKKPPTEIFPATLHELCLTMKQKFASLKVTSDGSELDVNGKRLNKVAGLIHLMRDFGMREKLARSVIKQADRKKVVSLLVKSAYGLQESGPNAPAYLDPYETSDNIFHSGATQQQPLNYQQVVPEMMASHNYDPSRHQARTTHDQNTYDQNPMQIAMQAAQSGQKDVFDTATLGTLLKATKNDSLIDRHLGDLMKGMDRVGRIYFQLLWHNDEFADRYGKHDLPELEDSLRNAFESIGDVTLYLKQRTVQPYPEEDNIDISDTADE
jgi:hypothetical protein